MSFWMCLGVSEGRFWTFNFMCEGKAYHCLFVSILKWFWWRASPQNHFLVNKWAALLPAYCIPSTSLLLIDHSFITAQLGHWNFGSQEILNQPLLYQVFLKTSCTSLIHWTFECMLYSLPSDGKFGVGKTNLHVLPVRVKCCIYFRGLVLGGWDD